MSQRTGDEAESPAGTLHASPRASPSTALIDTENAGLRDAAAAEPEVGTSVGRYIVLARVGAGGMGVVFAGYDPELDRKVAIKLLHGLRDEDEQEALLHEAQALARLAHPNVVTVHDVGTHDHRVFIAMEFVRGETLRAWGRRPRSWREVLAVTLDVGEGLVAAHAAGLVHRDLKPDNVMVGTDGRVRVMDFGLARASDAPTATTQSGRSTSRGIGTPAYMAPEAIDGDEIDASGDQFSFCVTLHELLYGVRPHGGDTVAAVSASISLGQIREAPAGVRVPSWLRKIVLRGLSTEPGRRYPSMRALLDALRADPTRARRRWLVAAGGVALIGAVAGGSLWSKHRESTRCRDAAEQLAGSWSSTRAEAIRTAFVATGLAYAGEASDRVVTDLGAWSDAWLDVNEPACRHRDAGVPAQLRAAQAVCLAGRRRELGALVEVLEQADVTVVEKAIDALAELPRPERCGDLEYLAAAVKPPDDPALAAAVDDARIELAAARALRAAGKYSESRARAEAVRARAEPQAYAPLLAEALLQRARAADDMGDYGDATGDLARAYELALGSGHDEVAVRAAISLTDLQIDLGAYERADEWLLHARALALRLGDPAEISAMVSRVTGILHMRRDEIERARAVFEALLAELGDDAPDIELASIHTALGSAAYLRSEHAQALEHYRLALPAYERAYGPNHPKIVPALGNVATARNGLGDDEGALADYERALEIAERSLGPDHPTTAVVLNNLANVVRQRGELARAKELYGRVISIRERRLGPDHPQVGSVVANLGLVIADEGDVANGAETVARAQAILEKALGPKHSMVAMAKQMHAGLLQRQGDFAGAEALIAPACETLRAAQGELSRDVASCEIELAELLVRRGERDAARRFAEGLLTFVERNADAMLSARLRLLQAGIAWADGERERAVGFASAARDLVGTDALDERELRSRADRWLAEHR